MNFDFQKVYATHNEAVKALNSAYAAVRMQLNTALVNDDPAMEFEARETLERGLTIGELLQDMQRCCKCRERYLYRGSR